MDILPTQHVLHLHIEGNPTTSNDRCSGSYQIWYLVMAMVVEHCIRSFRCNSGPLSTLTVSFQISNQTISSSWYAMNIVNYVLMAPQESLIFRKPPMGNRIWSTSDQSLSNPQVLRILQPQPSVILICSSSSWAFTLISWFSFTDSSRAVLEAKSFFHKCKRRSVQVVFVGLDPLNELHITEPNLRHNLWGSCMNLDIFLFHTVMWVSKAVHSNRTNQVWIDTLV